MPIPYLIYDSLLGTAAARPIRVWGTVPEVADVAAQAIEAGEVAVQLADLTAFEGTVFDPTLTLDYLFTYNTTTFAISPVASASDTSMLQTIVGRRMQVLLNDSDHYVTPERLISDTRFDVWKTYRDALRAVPAQPGYPGSVTWPTLPSLADDDTIPVWVRQFRRSNIINPVSMSFFGIPTGGLIEKGDNANGFYRRFACGMQLCWHAKASLTTGDETWTFPIAFASASGLSVFITPRVGALGAYMPDCRVPTVTAVAFSVVSTAAARLARSCHLLAFGQWP